MSAAAQIAVFNGWWLLLTACITPPVLSMGVTAGALQATCALGSCGVPPTHRLSAVKSGRICDVHTAKTDTTLSLGCVPAQILHLLCCQVNQ